MLTHVLDNDVDDLVWEQFRHFAHTRAGGAHRTWESAWNEFAHVNEGATGHVTIQLPTCQWCHGAPVFAPLECPRCHGTSGDTVRVRVREAEERPDRSDDEEEERDVTGLLEEEVNA